jgi:hypothetical protein
VLQITDVWFFIKSCVSEGAFFFMELSQRRVFPHNLMTPKQLKECMQQEVRAIPQEMLQKVRKNSAS